MDKVVNILGTRSLTNVWNTLTVLLVNSPEEQREVDNKEKEALRKLSNSRQAGDVFDSGI